MKDHEGNNIYPCPYYPVGSIYLSVNNINPSTFFGGTWEQIKDKFLLACGTTYSNGATGGASSVSYTPAGKVGNHTLTIAEMPSHTHKTASVYPFVIGGMRTAIANSTANDKTGTCDDVVEATGGGKAHNHGFTGTKATISTMPPYLAIYVWKRTA